MNKKIIEVVTFQVKNEVDEASFLKLSAFFGVALKREMDGFVKRSLTKHSKENKWVELIWWSSMESAQLALKKMPQTKEFKNYCSALEEDDTEIVYLEEKQWKHNYNMYIK